MICNIFKIIQFKGSTEKTINKHYWAVHYIYGDEYCTKCYKSKLELKKTNQIKTCEEKK